MKGSKININNIKNNLEIVANLYNSHEEGYTRLPFSKEELQSIYWVENKLKSYGISTRIDSIGNLFGRIGPEDIPAAAFGSHLDSVQNGGLFDGALGVIVGLECLIYLKENGFAKNNAYELICFRAEEGNPLGGTLGSRVLTGEFNLNELDVNTLSTLNLTKESILSAHKTLKEYKLFIELHIEQGTILEDNDNKTGIVTNIAGINRQKITIFGEAGHSGTVPMNKRNDALVSASEVIKFVNSESSKLNNGTVATIGQLNVLPNSSTVIPNEVEMTLEVRSGDQKHLDNFVEFVLDWINGKYTVEVRELVKKKASSLSHDVINLIEKTANELEINSMKIVSGANHDSNSLVKYTDVGMIFVPSIKGISHNPKEDSNWEDIEKGAVLMLNTLKKVNDL